VIFLFKTKQTVRRGKSSNCLVSVLRSSHRMV